jgi:hypothetical protein
VCISRTEEKKGRRKKEIGKGSSINTLELVGIKRTPTIGQLPILPKRPRRKESARQIIKFIPA